MRSPLARIVGTNGGALNGFRLRGASARLPADGRRLPGRQRCVAGRKRQLATLAIGRKQSAAPQKVIHRPRSVYSVNSQSHETVRVRIRFIRGPFADENINIPDSAPDIKNRDQHRSGFSYDSFIPRFYRGHGAHR